MGGSITRLTPLWFLGIEGQDTEKGFDVRKKQERSFGKSGFAWLYSLHEKLLHLLNAWREDSGAYLGTLEGSWQKKANYAVIIDSE